MNWNPAEEIPKVIEQLKIMKKQGPPHTRDKEQIKEYREKLQKTIDELKSVLKLYKS